MTTSVLLPYSIKADAGPGSLCCTADAIAKLTADALAAWLSPYDLLRPLQAPASVDRRTAFNTMVGMAAQLGWVHETDGKTISRISSDPHLKTLLLL